MKFDSPRVMTWYAAALGVAAGAVMSAYLGFGAAMLGALGFAAVSYGSLAAVAGSADPAAYEKTSEVVATIGMVLFLPLIIFIDFLVALVVFLGFAQLALNFQTIDYRRFYVGMTVSFIGICAGATESKSGFYLLFFLAYTISASLAIGYAHMAQRRQMTRGRWDLADRTRVCFLLIGLAVCVYLLLPRLPAGGLMAQSGSDHFYRNQQWEKEAEENEKHDAFDMIDELQQGEAPVPDHSAAEETLGEAPAQETAERSGDGQERFEYQGFEAELDINNPDEKGHRFSNRIVARMRADNPHYLRARIFDRFDGQRWYRSSQEMVKLSVGFDGVDLAPPDTYASSELKAYEIFIEHHLGDYIPAAAVPVNLNFPSNVIGLDRFGQLYAPGALMPGTVYAVTSKYNLQQGRLFAELDLQPLPGYTQVPRDLDPRIRELAARVIHGLASQMAGAIALEQHLRNEYAYDLQSAFTSQSVTPLSEFLFETRSGHCEYFASALAIMLRTQQIPSRLVTGFSATNQNPLTGYYDIYALDGHAWVEAFVDGQGWLILEPTAYYDGPLTEQQELSAQQINDYVERQVKRRNELGQDRFTVSGLINAAWQMFYVVATAVLAYVKLLLVKTWPLLTGLLLIGICGLMAWQQYGARWRAYRLHRQVSRYPTEPPRQAIQFYLSAIERLLRLAGIKIPAGATIERYLAHLESIGVKRGAVGQQVDLAAAFNAVFYNDLTPGPSAAQDYRRLFQLLYRIDFGDLRSMAGRRPRPGAPADSKNSPVGRDR